MARLQGLAIALDPSSVPTSGGGWPLMDGWARATLSPTGPRLWQALTHQSACLSCAWGTGGQNGGFRDELGEPLQRCLKSVEAIQAELQPALPQQVFAGRTLAQLQQLSSAECDRLGRLDRPLLQRGCLSAAAAAAPIRGHSNVQGFGSMGVTVHLREPMRRALCARTEAGRAIRSDRHRGGTPRPRQWLSKGWRLRGGE